ncbi:hypothetical protein ACJ41O_006528 [Fusarium nematophilum]
MLQLGGSEISPSQDSYQHRQTVRAFSKLRLSSDLPQFVSPCGLALNSQELEAIRYFRDSFAPLYITKNPTYSVFSIMLQMATDDALLMHMVLAIGCRGIDFGRQRSQDPATLPREQEEAPPSTQRSVGLRHYSAALQTMAGIVANDAASAYMDLDVLTSTLFLMIMYEQIHGDSRCQGLSTHLVGVSHIIERRYGHALRHLSSSPGREHQGRGCALMRTAEPEISTQLSQYSARLLARISGMDSSASFYGLGGQVTGILQNMMTADGDRRKSISHSELMDNVNRLEKYSNPLYRAVWGDRYPQTEMVDDLENRSVYDLLGACTQLRFMVSKLAGVVTHVDSAAAAPLISDVEAAIRHLGQRYADLLEVAVGLSMDTDNSHRLVANVRWIVPSYYAEVLKFLRISRGKRPEVESSAEHQNALRIITSLAVQGFRHEGDAAMLRIAHPLFIVALETNDEVHRQWILERFDGLSQFGRHFSRARDFLSRNMRRPLTTTARQDLTAKFLDEASSLCFCLF